jgi:hypothetical protein
VFKTVFATADYQLIVGHTAAPFVNTPEITRRTNTVLTRETLVGHLFQLRSPDPSDASNSVGKGLLRLSAAVGSRDFVEGAR